LKTKDFPDEKHAWWKTRSVLQRLVCAQRFKVYFLPLRKRYSLHISSVYHTKFITPPPPPKKKWSKLRFLILKHLVRVYSNNRALSSWQHTCTNKYIYEHADVNNQSYLFICLCILMVMHVLFGIFCFHRASWHSSSILTEVFPVLFP